MHLKYRRNRKTAHGQNVPLAPQPSTGPKRFQGSVELDPTRVGRDAGRIADEVISHLASLVGTTVTVTLKTAGR
jgi:hypothetical protein